MSVEDFELPSTPDVVLAYESKLLAVKTSLTRFDNEERLDIGLIMAIPRDADNRDAAWLIMRKEGLDAESRTWVNSEPTRTMQRTTGPMKAYWQFVQRVVASKRGEYFKTTI